MIRTIHPIGQGAFYSEQFENFTVVYDCGEWKKTKIAEQIVEETNFHDSKIDLLFISHFDYDHVCLIPLLKDKYYIHTCILPLLSKFDKIILSNIYKAMNEKNLARLVEDPKSFFGNGTRIIYVNYQPNNEDYGIKHDYIDSFDTIPDGKVLASGTELYISKIDWLFVPYNIEFESRRETLIQHLQNNNIIILLLLIDYSDYIDEHIKDIRKAYRMLPGGINSNSMYLFSGATNSTHKTGCVYTGDGHLKFVKDIYKDYLPYVETIQLPHHGSYKNYDFSFLSYLKERYVLFASYGMKNTYGHPSKRVISDIGGNHSYFFPVSEIKESKFVEEIYPYKKMKIKLF